MHSSQTILDIGSAKAPTVLLTGGCGYIGAHTAAELLRRSDYRVVLLDNFARSAPAVIDRIAEAGGRAVDFVEADLRDGDGLRQSLAHLPDVAAVVHFAALKSVPESVERPVDYYDNNVGGMINLLAWMRERGCPRLVFSSSCAVYGEVGPGESPVSESTPTGQPANPYAHTKQLGERLLALAPDLRGISLRYFNPSGADASGLLGEGASGSLTSRLCSAAARGLPVTVFGDDYPTRDGTCVRDYVHVSDVARAHVAALGWAFAADDPASEVVNLGRERGASVREAIAAFAAATGVELQVQLGARRAGDVGSIYADCTKAERVLGWRAELGLEAMMGSAYRAVAKAEALLPTERQAQ